MSLTYESSKQFCHSLNEVATLADFAKKEDLANNQSNRILFLKLAIVTMVTKFQVFVESILDEFMYEIKKVNVKYNKIPIYMRLNSLRIQCQEYELSKKFNNREAYKSDLYRKVKNHLSTLTKHYSSDTLDNGFVLTTKFPLGKTGKNDLIKLFQQFEGKDIFQNRKVDIDKIDSIFLKRHRIVHQDSCDQLTEGDVLSDQQYLEILAKYIDNYLVKQIAGYKRRT